MRGRTPLRLGGVLGIFVGSVCARPLPALAPGRPAPVGTTPSVLLVVLDDVGLEKLAIYGERQQPPEPWPVTPTIDALAATGVTFTNVHANPTCSATRLQILTGRHGFRTGVHTFIGFDGGGTNYVIPDSERFLPELLRDGFAPGSDPGYRSALFGKWHLAPEVDFTVCDPIENGFERFSGHIGNHPDHFSWPKLEAIAAPGNFDCLAIEPGATETLWSATYVSREAESWIASVNDPFLAVVTFHPPHGPMQVPELVSNEGLHVSPGTLNELRAAGLDQPGLKVPTPFPCSNPPAQTTYEARLVYRAMLEAVDFELGRIVAACPSGTTIVVIGDNGTPDTVLPIDLVAPVAFGPPYPAQHSKRSIGHLGTRIPLIVSGPLVASPGRFSNELVGVTDLYATIAELTGADATTGPTTDSLSFLSVLTSATGTSLRRFALSEYALENGWVWIDAQNEWFNRITGATSTRPPQPYYRALTDGRFRYIRTSSVSALDACPPGPPLVCPEPEYIEELYDISIDPNELTSLICTPTAASSAALTALRSEMDKLPCPCF